MKRCLPQVNISFFMFLKEQSKLYTTIGTKKRQFFSTVVFCFHQPRRGIKHVISAVLSAFFAAVCSSCKAD